jgi:NADH:ubiquinone oxidoreductase subunit K
MEMVIGNEELNFIVLSQFYSIIDCYVFLLFALILIVIYSFSIDVS